MDFKQVFKKLTFQNFLRWQMSTFFVFFFLKASLSKGDVISFGINPTNDMIRQSLVVVFLGMENIRKELVSVLYNQE